MVWGRRNTPPSRSAIQHLELFGAQLDTRGHRNGPHIAQVLDLTWQHGVGHENIRAEPAAGLGKLGKDRLLEVDIGSAELAQTQISGAGEKKMYKKLEQSIKDYNSKYEDVEGYR